MVECTTGELVLLYLAEREGRDVESRRPVSFGDLADALDINDEALADRVELLSSLSDLEGDGLVAERAVDGDEERMGYDLTDEGRWEVEEVRDRIAGETVDVATDGGVETVPVGDLNDRLAIGSIAAALARQGADGVVRVGETEVERFVNREAELETVGDLLSAVENGSPRTLLVGGAEGIGKTTFVEEAADAARDRGFAVHVGTGRMDADVPYAPVREAIADAVDEYPALEDPFRQAAGATEDEDAFEAHRTKLFQEVAGAIEAVASEGLALFVFDDLHWTGDATLSLVAHLVEAVDAPALLVGAYRHEDMPDEHPLEPLHGTGEEDADDEAGEEDAGDEGSGDGDDAGHDHVTAMDLGPFDREATRGLVEYHVGSPEVPDHVVDIVHERTGGTPLFVVESVKRLVDDGLVDPDNDFYPDDPEEIPIPDRVEAAIDIRLGVLDDDGEAVLEAAGIAGESASIDLLDAVCSVPRSEIQEYVDLLVDGRVLEYGPDGLRFASDVVRETVLDRIDDDRSRHLHRKVAEALLADAAAPDELAATVAAHFEAAGDDERAIEWYRRAADDAMDVYANEVALENNRRALQLARDRDDDETVQELLVSIGRTHYVRSDYEEAERYFGYVRDRADGDRYMTATQYLAAIRNDRGESEAALDLVADGLEYWDGETPREVVCDLLTRRSWAQRMLGRLDESAATARREYDLAVALADDFRIGRAYHGLGLAEYDRGNLEAAAAHMAAALDRYEAAGRPWRVAKARNNMGIIHWRSGDLDQSRQAFERTRETEREIGDETGVASSTLNLGAVEAKRGNWEAALDHYAEARERATELELQDTVWLTTANAGELRFKRGELQEATTQLRSALSQFDEMGQDRSRAIFRTNLSQVYLATGRIDDAREVVETALAIAEEIDARTEVSHAHRQLAAIARARGDVQGAVDHAETAVEIATEVGSDPQLMVGARSEMARVLLAADRPEDALSHAREAVDLTDDINDPWWQLRASASLGAALRATGDHDAAETRLASALETARENGARLEEGRVLLDVGKLQRARGDHGRATDTVETALEIAREIGAEHLAERSRAVLDEQADADTR